ncbi:hypothetical protein DYH09_35690 [bacterium CPR1]|nr:hypothetical protein [bacterium CPR1]
MDTPPTAGWWDKLSPRGQRAILSLLDLTVRKIPGALDAMPPEERQQRINQRKAEILREAGL